MAAVQVVDGIDEALALADGTSFGLAAVASDGGAARRSC